MIITILVLISDIDYSSAKTVSMTSACFPAGVCITVICIDKQPYEKVVTNPSNDTKYGNFLENKINTIQLPQESFTSQCENNPFTN